MKKNFLEIGKIVGTHGIKGMVRIDPWADNGEFLTNFKTFYTENGKSEISVKRVIPHGRVVLAEIEGVDSIEKAETLRNKVLFIKRSDADIEDGRYFIAELLSCDVFDYETNENLGKITEVFSTGANDVWQVTKDNKNYLVPAIEDVLKEIDVENNRVVIKPLKGIFDDEN